MKTQIHPKTHTITVTCACGAKFTTNSIKDSLSVEICSQCHPFYTGKQKLVDTAGMVDKFRARQAAAEKKKETSSKK